MRLPCLGQPVGQRGEAAPVVGQPFPAAPATAAAPQLELVPEPDRRHFFRQVAELPVQERLPHHPIDPLAAHLAQPVCGGPVFEGAPVLHPARPERQQAEAEAVEERQWREAQEVEGCGEFEEVVGVVRTGPGRPRQHLVGLPQLRDEIHHVDVVGEPVVVELLEPRAASGKAAGEAADFGVALQHRGADAAPAELVSRGKSAEAAADHRDVGPGDAGRRPATHRREFPLPRGSCRSRPR